jgi:hypothetical protein
MIKNSVINVETLRAYFAMPLVTACQLQPRTSRIAASRKFGSNHFSAENKLLDQPE